MNGSKQTRRTKQSGVLISLLLLLSGCQVIGALDNVGLNPRELPLTGPVAGVAGSLLYANGLVLRSYEISTGAFRDLATFPTDSYADHPAVSPDASTMAFTLYHVNRAESEPENGADLMLMNVDGTNQRVLAAHALPGEWLTDAAWSADGATCLSLVSILPTHRASSVSISIAEHETLSSQMVIVLAFLRMARPLRFCATRLGVVRDCTWLR
jgi:hypothetical protein